MWSLVKVNNPAPDLVNPLEVLEKYAKYSGFNLENLTYSYVANLNFKEINNEEGKISSFN